MNQQDELLIQTILDSVAIHINKSIFDHLVAEMIEIGAIEADAAEPALEMYDRSVEGEDMD
jgi:hypothetical protein